ncbi:MAG: hypothetical protein ABIH24_03405 [Verrucomicrobiota bacterium]
MNYCWHYIVMLPLVLKLVVPVIGDEPSAAPQAIPADATSKPAVEINKQSGSIAPTLTISQPSGRPIFTLKPYGYVKLDAAYDTSRVQIGDYALYVLPTINGERNNEFNMTARETRIGLELMGPDTENWKTTGKIETDFYGPGGTANSANLRMRLGYLNLSHSGGFAVRAGQDWDTFITVIPRMLNLALLNDSGQLGIRRPQLRLSQAVPLGASKFTAQVAAARPIGEDLDGGGQDDGADSGVPVFQYNVLFETPLLTAKASKFSISGLIGREKLDSTISNNVVITEEQNYNSWAVIGSVFLPVHQKIALHGTLWTGANLDTYYGGIGQGINTIKQTSIGAQGFWIQIMTEPIKNLNWNIGYGFDDPHNGDLNKGDRARNTSIFTSLYYNLTTAVILGIEYFNMTTAYLQGEDVCDNRLQGSMIYKF